MPLPGSFTVSLSILPGSTSSMRSRPMSISSIPNLELHPLLGSQGVSRVRERGQAKGVHTINWGNMTGIPRCDSRPLEGRSMRAKHFRCDDEISLSPVGGRRAVGVQEDLPCGCHQAGGVCVKVRPALSRRSVRLGQCVSVLDRQTLRVGICVCVDTCLGKGIGTRSLSLWFDYWSVDGMVHRIGLDTWSLNGRVMRVAEKCGFASEGIESELAHITPSRLLIGRYSRRRWRQDLPPECGQ